DFVVKKTAHMIEYGIFSAILFRAFKESGNPVRQAGVYAILIAIAYAITDEFHQMFTPGREPTFRDIVFDTIGASLGVYMLSRNDRIRS
ncbi:VanZ family protein, partial [Candidatus Woesebacteria bacterium]|nr:VanZ family protein [Candidatus Woesebacteria bacterium]